MIQEHQIRCTHWPKCRWHGRTSVKWESAEVAKDAAESDIPCILGEPDCPLCGYAVETVPPLERKTIQVEDQGPRGEPYMSDDGSIGEFVTYLLSRLDEQRDMHPGERADAIGLHPVIFDRIYQHVHGSLTPNRNAIRATRRVGDDYEAIWLHPEPEITDLAEVLFGRRQVT